MKHILLFPNIKKDVKLTLTTSVANFLCECGCTVYLSQEFYIESSVEYYSGKIPKECEMIIVIGGDGTVIESVTIALDNNIPVLGVNLGKVGYLAEIEPSELSLLELLCNDDFVIEEKILLDCEVICDGLSVREIKNVLNDVLVSRKTENPMASIAVRYNGQKALNYRADGVILSTPQGATAYSLSCGGPMLSHELAAISLTPIAPHSFFNRSMVFSDSAVFEIENRGEVPLLLIADGKMICELSEKAFVRVYKSPQTLKMISLKKEGQIQSIFRKLRRIENI